MLLVIKGNAIEALKAAELRGAVKCRVWSSQLRERCRGFSRRNPQYHVPPGGIGAQVAPQGSVTIECSGIDLAQAAMWLAEPPHEPEFPVGSLLWFKPE